MGVWSPNQIDTDIDMSDIYIMYGNDTRSWAQETMKDLSTRGYSCFDRESKIKFGESIFKTMSRCIQECGLCLVAMTPAGLADSHFMYGIDMALFGHISGICCMVVVKIESCLVPDELRVCTPTLDVREPDFLDNLLAVISKGNFFCFKEKYFFLLMIDITN